MTRITPGYTSIAVFIAILTPAAFATERELKMSEVPPVVLKAVTTRYSNAKPTKCSIEKEKGATIYEVTLEVTGRPTELMISPEGVIVAEEQVIDVKDLPASVARTFSTSSYAKATILRVEREMTGKDTRYEFTVEQRGKKTELVIDADGKLINPEMK